MDKQEKADIERMKREKKEALSIALPQHRKLIREGYKKKRRGIKKSSKIRTQKHIDEELADWYDGR